MSDLTSRLRAPNDDITKLFNDVYEAADKIESQAAEIERLRGVLENIRDHAISNGEDCAYLDARAALKETQ